jgi:putative endonuclease
MKTWYTYIVQCADGTYYTGITTELSRRLNEHNNTSRGAKYTKTRRPVELVFYSEHSSRSLAQREEWRIKKLSRVEKGLLIIANLHTMEKI